jgi:hypothetical protein
MMVTWECAMPGSRRDAFFDRILNRLFDLKSGSPRKIKKEPDETEDPYAYVGAPKKPRPPMRSAAAAAEFER